MRIRSKTTGSAGRIDSPGSIFEIQQQHQQLIMNRIQVQQQPMMNPIQVQQKHQQPVMKLIKVQQQPIMNPIQVQRKHQQPVMKRIKVQQQTVGMILQKRYWSLYMVAIEFFNTTKICREKIKVYSMITSRC